MGTFLSIWHQEHLRFARVLDLLEVQLHAFHAGGEPDYALMCELVTGLRDFADRVHHPREDVAFERMAAHDPDTRFIANRLQQEHRVIARAGEELVARLTAIGEDVIVERAAVEAAAGTYLVYYRHHLATEEREVLPRAARLLTAEDWAAVASAVVSPPDPLFGPDFEARYDLLRRRAAAAVDRR